MGERDSRVDNKRFGRYLRNLREDRKLSLDAVEEMTTAYPDRVTKSHLSRIENGSAVPSFGKMFALSQVYGVPIAALAERFEMDLLREIAPAVPTPTSARELLAALEKYKMAGDYAAGLALLASTRETTLPDAAAGSERTVELRVYEVDFLAHLGRYELAKVRCEQMLGRPEITKKQRLQFLMTFVICCYRLKRYTIAQMALEEVERSIHGAAGAPRLEATFTAVRAVVQTALGQYREAIETYARAIRLYREVQDPFEACKAQVNLAQTLIHDGQASKALHHLRSALKVATDSGYDKLAALALSHLSVIGYGKGELAVAEGYALRSNAIARPREYLSLIFRNCYYLRAVALKRGDAASAKQNEKTLKSYLNRVDPDLPEVAEFRAELAGGGR